MNLIEQNIPNVLLTWSVNRTSQDKYFSLKIMQKMGQGNQFQTAFCFLKKALYQVKASGLQLDFTIFRQPSNQHITETNCLKLYTADPEMFSNLVFQMRVCQQFLQHILCMIFQQRRSSCYILLTDKISLSGCLYFLRYCAICVLQLFVTQSLTSWILKLTLSF